MNHPQILDLDDLDIAFRQEDAKRRNLANIPERVAILTRDYVHSGGDPHTLLRIIADNAAVLSSRTVPEHAG